MDSPHAAPVAAPRHTWLALAAVLLCLAAPLAWTATIDQPWLRATGALAWVSAGLGLTLALVAARCDRRWWVRAIAVFALAWLGGLFWSFFRFAKLPAASAPAERAPNFGLFDHLGRPFVLYDELSKGPVLLVFFRGHW